MGFHSYDSWDGIADHLPWPPGSSTVAAAASRRTSSPPAAVARRKRRKRRKGRRRRQQQQHRLGSPHNDFLWSSEAVSSSFTDPLYYELAVNSTLALLDMFATRGTPINYINLNYDELQAVARDSRSLLSGQTNGQLVANSINTVAASIEKL